MAASSAPQGYQCEFIDSVPEDFYCKQCSLVARKLTITSCCGESYCNACMHSNKPCPGCGMVNFETFQQAKYQKKILTLQVSCSLKKRGCGWCGPLEHLDTHLDSDTGDCEYTDIDCPLKCHNKISKKNIRHHLANECVKRDYVCPHCAFKASYEIVCNIHWPECRYFPLTCPNRCGVTCERTTMEEDHMKICPLQEVECELKHIGCAERFLREDEEEHMREKAQTHLLMMATTSVKMSQNFQGKLQEQERKSQEQERKSQEQERKLQEQERKSEEQERKLQEQEGKLQEQERKSQEQERKLQEQEEKSQEQERKSQEQERKLQEQERKSQEQERKSQEQEEKSQEQERKSQEQERKSQEQERKSQEQERKSQEQERKLQEQERKSQEQERKSQEQERKSQEQERKLQEQKEKFEKMLIVQRKESEEKLKELKTEITDLKRMCGVLWSFTKDNFSKERADDWKSPPMYIHMCGYKFCIGIYNENSWTSGKYVNVDLWLMKGEYDFQLKWPVTAKFTLELINHFEGGENKKCKLTASWVRPDKEYFFGGSFSTTWFTSHFISHTELPYKPATRTHFLRNNALCFKITNITI